MLILLDSVQFDRSSLQHRAKLAGSQGLVWLTLPFVHRFPQRIDEVRIADRRWATKHPKTLQSLYGRSPGYKSVMSECQAIFDDRAERLVEITAPSVLALMRAFDVTPTQVLFASQLNVPGEKSELVLNLCREVKATRYIAGPTGAGYLDQASFRAAGVEIEVHEFKNTSYPTLAVATQPDMAGLSALDVWFRLGDTALRLLHEPAMLANLSASVSLHEEA